MKNSIIYKAAIIVSLFALVGIASAQTSSISGFLKYGTSPMASATVTILETGESKTTNEAGYYTFSGVETGATITLDVTLAETNPARQRVIVVAPGVNTADFWFNAASDFDENNYNATYIGNQVWMTENLRSVTYNDHSGEVPYISTTDEWSVLSGPGSCFYNNGLAPYPYDEANGYLYNWHAVNTGKLCPTGWHVPTDAEFASLISYVGGIENGGGKLREVGINHWADPNGGASNETGFTGVGGGDREASGLFGSIKYNGFWWSSSVGSSETTAWILGLVPNSNSMSHYDENKNFGFSVRCINDILLPSVTTNPYVTDITTIWAVSGGEVTSDGGSTVISRGICWGKDPAPNIGDNFAEAETSTFTITASVLEPNTTYYLRAYATNEVGTGYGEVVSFTTYNTDDIRDADGNYYKKVNIGTQTWLAENLKTTSYNNGDPIGSTAPNTDISIESEPRYQWAKNEDESRVQRFGRLYTWYAIADPRGVCPTSWHVSTNEDWTILTTYLGGASTAGDLLKSVDTPHTYDPGPTNGSGFSAVLNGFRNEMFFDTQGMGLWWTSTESDAGNSMRRWMTYYGPEVLNSPYLKYYGYSVRCMMDMLSSLTTTAISSITPTSAQSGGNITYNGGVPVTAKGVCYSIDPNPDISTLKTNDGTGSGTFTSILTDLIPNKTYYVRAYATNSVGTAYGEEISFTTAAVAPSVTTSAISDIRPISATGGGDVTSDGGSPITVKGIVWNTTGTPNYLVDKGWQAGSAGTGSFVAYVNGALPSTLYHVRAFAVNGVGTSYGEEMDFTTSASFGPVTFDGTYGTVTDVDLNPYRTIQIGELIWMAENLKTTRFNDGSPITSIIDQTEWDAQDGSEGHTTPAYCWFDNNAPVCKDIFGALYNWYAVNSGKLCPAGWRVPTDAEWTTMITSQGGTDIAGNKLKETGTAHWGASNPEATNSTGFTALGGGLRGTGGFWYVTVYGYWWSGTEASANDAWNIDLSSESGGVGLNSNLKRSGFSVRCVTELAIPSVTTSEAIAVTPFSAAAGGTIVSDGGAAVTERGVCWSTLINPTTSDPKAPDNAPAGTTYTLAFNNLSPNTLYYLRAYAVNSMGTAYGNQVSFTTTQNYDPVSFKPETEYGTVTDADGNNYKTIKIGNQTWMAENLKTTKFNSGTDIPQVTDNAQWSGTAIPAYCWYNNERSFYGDMFGALYNWYSVQSGNLCPSGWHVPSKDDWEILSSYLEGMTAAGGKLKEKDLLHWNYPNTGATNETGFTALPGGDRTFDNGSFDGIGTIAFYWTSTEYDESKSWCNVLACNNNWLSYGNEDNNWGFAVRCLKNPDPLEVTNTSDIGTGSLRAAIEFANSNPGKDEITFSIYGEAPFEILPATPLPEITDSVKINGYSQPGSLPATNSSPATILINLVGTNAGETAVGLKIMSGNSEISGLYISHFHDGIGLYEKGNNIIRGNYIGNYIMDYSNSNLNGIYIYSSDNIIGGSSPAERNIISGNMQGIKIDNVGDGSIPGWGRNKIIGNYIGTDITGNVPLGNDGLGINIIDSPDNIIGGQGPGERNIISGNNDGIRIQHFINENLLGNKILGNYIGTNFDGTKKVGGMERGIWINSRGNQIGGKEAGSGNLICGNNHGILLETDAVSNIIQGNYIGIDRSGFKALSNSRGIDITGGKNNQVGGSEPNQGNLISGNLEEAILIHGLFGVPPFTSEGNKIQGNYIGTDKSGEGALGNESNGIEFGMYANHNLIGGNEPGAGNIIAFNKGKGVVLTGGSNPGTSNSILSNSIYSNGGLGIDLGDDGVTDNDDESNPGGANNLQNFPELTSVSFSPGYVKINGTLTSRIDEPFTIQYFASKQKDNSGNGEGQTYLGSETVNTDGSTGIATFSSTLKINGVDGQVITTTSTDQNGNTSEFSKAVGGLADQTVSGGTLHYVINNQGVPGIADGSDILAVEKAFQSWDDIPTASITLIKDPDTSVKYANANDHLNLVSFVDDQYGWTPGVLAYSAKTVDMAANGGKGEIIDADIIVNPAFAKFLKGTVNPVEPGSNGYYDIQSIITHEIGHNLGLIHSCILNSTMFPWLNPGTTDLRSLEPDDIAWASYNYQGGSYSTTFGTISGDITYGYSPYPKVTGALITAINAANPGLCFNSYSGEDGKYVIPVSAPSGTSSSYYIHIQPLDGSVYIRSLNGTLYYEYPIEPGNISNYIYSNTVYFDYPNEYYNSGDSNNDDNVPREAVTASPGSDKPDINLTTNIDATPPKVVSITPASGSKVEILPDIIIAFSEPVDITTFSDASCYLQVSSSGTDKYFGSYTKLGGDSNAIIFTPDDPLPYSTSFDLHLLGQINTNTKGITDLRGNPLDLTGLAPYGITTVSADDVPPTVLCTLPADGATGVFVTANISVSFSEPMDKNSVQDNFTVKGGGGTITGSFSWNNELTTVIFTPAKSLSEEASYTVKLADKLMDLNHIRLGGNDGTDDDDNISFTFSTVIEAQPQITYFGPADGTTGVAVTTPVVIDFTEPINTATVNSSTFKLSLNGSNVPGSFEFLSEDSRVVFRPDEDLAFGKSYKVTLDPSSIFDVSVPALSLYMAGKPATTTFTTAAEPLAPSINTIDAPTGAHGDKVTISGEGFDPNPLMNTVTFAGISATVTGATLNSLAVIVPATAVSGNVNVTVKGKTTVNGYFFFVIPDKFDLPDMWITSGTNTGSNSKGVTITADGSTAYVTNFGSNTVSRIDMATLAKTRDYIVGEKPLNIDLNPTGTKAYVTNSGSHTVSVIDLITNSVKEINVGLNPYGIAVTPNGEKVYVGNYTSQTVSVIDVNPKSGGFDHVVANVNTGTGNKGTSVTGDAGLVLVAGDDGLKIIDINPKDANYNCVVATSASGTKTTVAHPNGEATLAVVTTAEGTILLIDILPQSDLFGTIVASAGSGSNVNKGKPSGEGLHVFATTNDGTVIIYEISIGEAVGGTIPSGGSNAGKIELKEVATITGTGNEDLIFDPKNDRLLTVWSGTGTNDGQLRVTRLTRGAITAESRLSGLIMVVQEMINTGAIKRGNGNELISFLTKALTYIQQNKTKDAISRLNTFITKVKDYIKSRQIDARQGQALVNEATAIINMLKNTKSDETDLNLDDAAYQPDHEIIGETKLASIYPNPTRNAITIEYELCAEDLNSGKVMVQVYDVSGKLINNLVSANMEPGKYSVTWKGYSDTGVPASHGVYFIRLKAGRVEQVRQVMLIR